MIVPASPLTPVDDGYDEIYDLWDGVSGFVENQSEGWLRRVIWPDMGADPTFVLMCSAEGETTDDLDSDVTGYGLVMATAQSTLGDRALPRDPVS